MRFKGVLFNPGSMTHLALLILAKKNIEKNEKLQSESPQMEQIPNFNGQKSLDFKWTEFRIPMNLCEFYIQGSISCDSDGSSQLQKDSDVT